MGFDLCIQMVITMCPIKGKPYYSVYNEETKQHEKVYGIPEIQIPEHLVKYLTGRGWHYQPYIENLANEGYARVDIALDQFPSVEEVKEHSSFDEDHWSEEDHNNFKELLEFLNDQKVDFQLSWSY